MTLQQIAINPTGWANAGPDYNPLQAAQSGINAIRQGAEERRTQDVFNQKMADKTELKQMVNQALDAWRSSNNAALRQTLGKIATVDPAEAGAIAELFGTLDFQSFGESAYNLFSAASVSDLEDQKKLVSNAKEIISASNPRHPFVAQLNQVAQNIDRAMSLPESEERTKAIESVNESIIGGVEFAKSIAPKLFGGSKGAGAAKSQKTGAITIVNPDTGKEMIAVGSYNPETESLTLKKADLPEGFQLASKIGETGEMLQERTVKTAEEKKLVEGSSARATTIIDEGLSASETLPILKRSIELLGTVKTSGWRAAIQPARDFFGVTGTDEGELINNLGTAVLQQLRPMLGAAFTEREGARLERIMANYGKNPEVNKRILGQVMKTVERKANLAIKRAESIGDNETADEIRQAMSFSLSPIGEKNDLKNMSVDERLKMLKGD